MDQMGPEFIFPPDFGGMSDEGIVRVNPPAKMLEELKQIVDFFFCKPVADYMAMPDEKYRDLVLQAQREMDHRQMVQRLAAEHYGLLSRLLWCGHLAGQTLRLRAARPRASQQVQEVLSWHRESFYNIAGAYMVNFWVPIDNVNVSTALQYVPKSHLIPDTDLKLEHWRDTRITSEHQKIGLLEHINKIVSGIDLSQAKPLVVLPGEAAIFHAALIHGQGENYSDKIRFSIDFRVFSSYNDKVAKEKERLMKAAKAAA